jgi:hypothetical protein
MSLVEVDGDTIAPARVPEPAAMFLVGAGPIGLVGFGKKLER